MAISLQKGGNVNLSKEAPGLAKLKLGLGWDVRSTDGAAFDLDGVVFLLNQAGKVRSDADFIFYNTLRSADGAVVHSGDNRTGAGAVVARVDDGAVGGAQGVVEDEVGVGTHLAGLVQQEHDAVQVERRAVRAAHVPAEAQFQFGQARRFFRQVDVTAFLQADCHDGSPSG